MEDNAQPTEPCQSGCKKPSLLSISFFNLHLIFKFICAPFKKLTGIIELPKFLYLTLYSAEQHQGAARQVNMNENILLPVWVSSHHRDLAKRMLPEGTPSRGCTGFHSASPGSCQHTGQCPLGATMVQGGGRHSHWPIPCQDTLNSRRPPKPT